MGRRWRRGLLILLVGWLATGCFVPPKPGFGAAGVVPREASRVAVRLPPGPDGTWALHVPELRLRGQGRTVVGVEGPSNREWRLALPPEFALTSPIPGTGHSALVREAQVILVGGRDGHRGPSAVAGLDAFQGRISWRHDLPADSAVFLADRHVVAATCGPASCLLTGWNALSGENVWSRTVPGAVKALDACRNLSDVAVARGSSDCGPYLVTRDRVGTVAPDTGAVYWYPGLRPPPGTVDRVIRYGSRIVLITEPVPGSCRATVLGSAMEPSKGDRGWSHTFVWDQPQAARDPRTGCRWDRTLPLDAGFRMVLPEAGGALAVHPHLGTGGPSQRLAPGEYLITDLTRDEVIRGPGRPDRLLDATDRPVRPRGLSPSARSVMPGFWQDGHRLLLLDHAGEVLWQATSDCRAWPAPPWLEDPRTADSLTYCDGDELVTLSPETDE
ncbi:PQQ-binding-like beta-propeller repeat protein [Streptomyces sp. NPDC059875]|uniref:outer membrane protein assembly factor BamB family protein n=1 Tax=unclassified Streptomyces TaxID=2593676 RepID=UPI0036626706